MKDCRTIGHPGDHRPGHLVHIGHIVGYWGLVWVGTPLRRRPPWVERQASHQVTVEPSSSHSMGMSYTVEWNKQKKVRTVSSVAMRMLRRAM